VLIAKSLEPAFPVIAPTARSVPVMTAEVAAIAVRQTIEHRKAPFLSLVEALIKRLCRVTQFLQRRSDLGHCSGASPRALDEIVARRQIAHRHCALNPMWIPVQIRKDDFAN